MKFVMVINFKMPSIVGILKFITRIKDIIYSSEQEIASFVNVLIFMNILNFMLKSMSMKSFK